MRIPVEGALPTRHEEMPKFDARRKKFTQTLTSQPYHTSTELPRMVPVTPSQLGVKEQAVISFIRTIVTMGGRLRNMLHGRAFSNHTMLERFPRAYHVSASHWWSTTCAIEGVLACLEASYDRSSFSQSEYIYH